MTTDRKKKWTRRLWTEAEDARLREQYALGASRESVAMLLGRSVDAVSWRAGLLGVQESKRPWTAEEDAYVKAHAMSSPIREIAAHLGRRDRAVGARRQALLPDVDFPKVAGRRGALEWTAEMDALIEKRCASETRWYVAVGEQIGRKPSTVRMRAKRLGLLHKDWAKLDEGIRRAIADGAACAREIAERVDLSRESVQRRLKVLGVKLPRMGTVRKLWTEAEDAFLRAHHGTKHTDLARQLGRSKAAVSLRAVHLGLAKARNRAIVIFGEAMPLTDAAAITGIPKAALYRMRDVDDDAMRAAIGRYAKRRAESAARAAVRG